MKPDWRMVVAFLMWGGGGCASFVPPEGYVKVSNPAFYDVKAVSARGNVIAMKTRANEAENADLKFWSEAVEHQKVDLDGMKLVGRESIKSKGGMEGVLFEFETGEGQGRHTYLLALYVTGRNIHTIEATGPGEQIAGDKGKLLEAMATMR